MMLDYAVWITQGLLAIAALCTVYRVFRGPSVLDRVISVDVMLIIVASMLLTDMVANNHQDFILFVLGTAVIGFLGAVAIARYVVVRQPDASSKGEEREAQAAALRAEAAAEEPEAPYNGELKVSAEPRTDQEDESTSWFTALARSGFVTRRSKQEQAQASDPEMSGPGQGRPGGGPDQGGAAEGDDADSGNVSSEDGAAENEAAAAGNGAAGVAARGETEDEGSEGSAAEQSGAEKEASKGDAGNGDGAGDDANAGDRDGGSKDGSGKGGQ